MKNVRIIRYVLLTVILTACIISITCTDFENAIQDEAKSVSEKEESMNWISKLMDDISSSLYTNSPQNSEPEIVENLDADIESEAKQHTDISTGSTEIESAKEGTAPASEESSADTTSLVDSKDASNASEVNVTVASFLEDVKSTRKSGRPTKVTCLERNETNSEELTVQVLNSTKLPPSFQTVVNMTVAPCVLALFYAPWCHFSAAASPHFNALPRIFPDITCVAINSAAFSSFNARFGTVAIPTLLLLHNGQPVAKFNETQYTLENFSEFVKRFTGLEPVGSINVTSSDFEGPLQSSPSLEPDYLLWTAWIFLVSYCCYAITRSTIWHRVIETLRNNWQEAEAQHEHGD